MHPSRPSRLPLAMLLCCAMVACAPRASSVAVPDAPDPPTPTRSDDEWDRDCDGIPDRVDRCPEQAEDKDGFEDDDGCPDPDDDRDGIIDECDDCPRDPETFNGFRDDDGCPDHGRVMIQSSHIQITPRVAFERGKTKPSAAATAVIEAVAAVMKEHPNIALIGVLGHASADEPNAHVLSERRAKTVVEAIVKLGVESHRLEPHGAGDALPIAPQTTKEGRELNRRVEFKIMVTDTGVQSSWDGAKFVDEVLPRAPDRVREPQRVCAPALRPALPAEPCRVPLR